MDPLITDPEPENPYRSPAADDVVYYAEDFTVFPRATIQRMFSQNLPWPLAFALACIFRARHYLGWPPAMTYAAGDWSTGRVVAFKDLPSRAVTKWAPYLERLRDLEYRPIECMLPKTIGAKQHAVMMLLDASGRTVALLEWIRMVGASGVEEFVSLELDSYREGAPDILTGGVVQTAMPLCEVLRLDGVESEFFPIEKTPVEKLDGRHQTRIAEWDVFRMTPETAPEQARNRAQVRFEVFVALGLLRPLTPEDADQIRSHSLPE